MDVEFFSDVCYHENMSQNNSEPDTPFHAERASSYDQRYARLAPLNDALHLLLRILFADLPADARLLCVGAGTGAELLSLAEHFPQWQFTAVEPAPAMLAICRQRAEAAGIASRCVFYEGYLDTLPDGTAFDAATSLLVSHFLLNEQELQQFFAQIAARLRPGGGFVNSVIASDLSSPEYARLLPIWLRMQKYAGISDEEVETIRAALGQTVAPKPLPQVAALIEASGFDAPTLFFQSLLIHAWYTKRNRN